MPFAQNFDSRTWFIRIFPESHLNTHQLDILKELIEFLELKFNWSIKAATHFAYSDLAIDDISGTNPDQDAEYFIQIIERKINFAAGDAPGDAG